MISRRAAILGFAPVLAMVSPALRPAFAQAAPQSPEKLIGELGIELLEMLKLEGRGDREQRFRDLMLRGVDVDLLAGFAIGRYRAELSGQQRTEYRKLFEDFLVATYVSRLGLFSGESFAIRNTQKLGDNEVLVQSLVERPDRPPIRLDWRVRDRGQGWKIIDVMVQGISMAVTQRDEFSSVIAGGGGKVEVLLARLREQATGG